MKSIRNFLFAAFAGFALTVTQTALSAPVIDFTDGSGHNTTSFQKTLSDGSATATFSNPVVETGTADFFNLSIGLALGSGGLAYTWDVTFDSTVVLHGVQLGYSGSNLGFDVVGSGVNALDILVGAGAGFYSIAPLTFLANESYTFTSNNICAQTSCGGVTFSIWDFGPAENVPVPATVALLCVGLAGIGYQRRKQTKVV